MIDHLDALDPLNQHISLKEKLMHAHRMMQQKFPFLARIAVTLYDPETKILKTYLHSSGTDNPLDHYQAVLDQAPSLKKILEEGKPRVINTPVTYDEDAPEHTQRLGRQGYAASYTQPMFYEGEFFGFLFFNSYEKEVFTEKALMDIDVYGHLISLMVINEMALVKALGAAMNTTSHITHLRDPETGSHLDRMSRYSRIIAKQLATTHNLDDAYIEHVFMFAPLHDIGKVAIPDSILLKPGKLTNEEYEIMKTHAQKGREIIEDIIDNFGLEGIEHIHLLRNIAQYHHEAVDGTGYPDGKASEDIPLEARIVAVADVFDALTSQRPYKRAWSNEEAIALITQLADEKLDRDCVDALITCVDDVIKIQRQFVGNPYG